MCKIWQIVGPAYNVFIISYVVTMFEYIPALIHSIQTSLFQETLAWLEPISSINSYDLSA